MRISTLETGLEKNSLPNLECNVCSDMFSGSNNKQPRVLCCGHTFCSKCLSHLVSHNTIECPACRKITALPNNLLSGLPINYALVDASDNLPGQTALLCQACNLREAIMYCGLCGPNGRLIDLNELFSQIIFNQLILNIFRVRRFQAV